MPNECVVVDFGMKGTVKSYKAGRDSGGILKNLRYWLMRVEDDNDSDDDKQDDIKIGGLKA